MPSSVDRTIPNIFGTLDQSSAQNFTLDKPQSGSTFRLRTFTRIVKTGALSRAEAGLMKLLEIWGHRCGRDIRGKAAF
jgi:hypothetical protein